eukprot:COSAG02_NODE_1979_length_10203_cov_19.985748_7_plen_88_part_00
MILHVYVLECVSDARNEGRTSRVTLMKSLVLVQLTDCTAVQVLPMDMPKVKQTTEYSASIHADMQAVSRYEHGPIISTTERRSYEWT